MNPPSRPDRRRRAIALYVLVSILAVVLFTMVFASAFMGSTTRRDLLRSMLTRACLEAAESAFRETLADMRESFATGGPGTASGVAWKRELLPPHTGVLDPKAVLGRFEAPESRTIYEAMPYELDLSNVEVGWISRMGPGEIDPATSLIRSQGVLEFRITLEGRRHNVRGRHRVIQRYSYYILHDPRVVALSSPGSASVPLDLSNTDAVVMNTPLATAFEEP